MADRGTPNPQPETAEERGECGECGERWRHHRLCSLEGFVAAAVDPSPPEAWRQNPLWINGYDEGYAASHADDSSQRTQVGWYDPIGHHFYDLEDLDRLDDTMRKYVESLAACWVEGEQP